MGRNHVNTLPTENPNVEFYTTENGIAYHADCSVLIQEQLREDYAGKVQLVFTSPPFPLNRAKRYGNLEGDEYMDWLCGIAKSLIPLLTEDGSMVVEIGNAWEKGTPAYSTLPLETLLALKKTCGMYVCQEFVYYNPARLPSPVEWVNKRRIRVKDAYTSIWWLSKTPFPYADNRNVLTEYGDKMKRLLEKGSYNSGKRPSEYGIGADSFLKDNGGAIPSNVIVAANTNSRDPYLAKCKEKGLAIHPARMPMEVASFFIKLLTRKGDLVFDCFAGSNITGAAAEQLGRKWLSCEIEDDYFKGSKFRFEESVVDE